MEFKGRRPILIALAAQVAAVLVTLASIQAHHALTGEDFPLWVKLGIACFSAGFTSILLGAAPGWALFLALLPALFVGALALSLPIWIPALVLVGLVLVLRNSLGERVPLYLSNRETLEKLSDRIPVGEPVQAVDLGCGLGAVPIHLAQGNQHPDSRFVGVENAPIPYILAKTLAWQAGDPRIEIRWQSLWDVDLGPFDIVYAFLSPHPMPALFEKARTEMKTGAVFISNSFTVPDAEPDETLPIDSGRATALLIWKMPGCKFDPPT